MYGSIVGGTIATRVGIRNYINLFKNIKWYNNVSVYHKLNGLDRSHRGSVFYTTGLSYKF